MSDGGKGSAPRPIADRKKFEENWDAIFSTNNRTVDGVGNGGVRPREDSRDCGGAQHGAQDKPSE